MRSRPDVSEQDLTDLRALVAACEEEFECVALDDEGNPVFPDDDKVSYPEEDCHLTFGHIRKARSAIEAIASRIAMDSFR